MGIKLVAYKIAKFASEIKNIYQQKGAKEMLFFLIERIKNYIIRGVDFVQDGLSAEFSRVLAMATGKNLVYVIGNSHVSAFRGDWRFIVCPIGAATAHNLNKKNSSTRSNEQLLEIISKIKRDRDYVMLVFGEIDCRIHFYNIYMKNKKRVSLPALMQRTISNYGEVLLLLKRKNFKLIVHGIPPASTQDNVYRVEFYAPSKIRVKINKKFNTILKVFCKKNSIPYFDVYSFTVDDYGFIKKEYAADEVHLNGKIKRIFWNWAREELPQLKQ